LSLQVYNIGKINALPLIAEHLTRSIGLQIVARDSSKCCMYICMSVTLLECN